MDLLDSHCHLSQLSEEDLHAVLFRAREAGVSTLMAIGAGYGFDDNLKTLAIANRHDNVYCALAMHPHDAKDVSDENFSKLKELIRNNPKVRAVGEIGLDYHYLNSPKDVQKDVLERFVNLAIELDKPVVIHDRDCGMDCADLLAAKGVGTVRGVVHCFTGTRELAERYLDLGFYVSFSGIITFKKADDLREIVKMVPPDRLLIETDAPFLAPVPHRGKPNEPAYVSLVAETVAGLRKLSPNEVATLTTANAKRLFQMGEFE